MKIISWQRAVTLVFLGKVEVLEEYEAQVNSAHTSLQIPSVIRLRKYHKQERRVKFSRLNVFRRDEFQCQYCGSKPSVHRLTLDHVVPRAQGGKTEWANIVACCGKCNSRKANRTPKEAEMTLKSLPVRPARMPLLLPSEVTEPIWNQYLDVG